MFDSTDRCLTAQTAQLLTPNTRLYMYIYCTHVPDRTGNYCFVIRRPPYTSPLPPPPHRQLSLFALVILVYCTKHHSSAPHQLSLSLFHLLDRKSPKTTPKSEHHCGFFSSSSADDQRIRELAAIHTLMRAVFFWFKRANM